MLSKFGRAFFAGPLARLAPHLHRLGVTPNGLSLAGFVLTLASTALIASGQLWWGGIVLWIAATFDMLDGSLARYANQVSKFGAFLDSTLDRYSESITLIGLAAYYANQPNSQTSLILIFFTLMGSWMVSYTRARAEGLGLECKVGILQRPERIVLLVAGLLLGWMGPVLWILAVLTNITALQRIHQVYSQTVGPTQSRPAGD